MSHISKFKTKSFCVVGRHYSGNIDILRVVTPKGSKMLKVNCTKCRRNNSMTVFMQQ